MVSAHNFNKRSRSNNSHMKGVYTGEMTMEQAAQLLNGSPQIFMRRQINDPYFAPIVTGMGLQGLNSNTIINFNPIQIEQTIATI